MNQNRKNMQELITDQAFYQWKQHDCTKALIKLLDISLEEAEQTILGHVENNLEINTDFLHQTKGGMVAVHELQNALLDKNKLEVTLEEEDENI